MTIALFMQDTAVLYGAERATLDLARGLRDAGERPIFFLLEESRLQGGPDRLGEAIESNGLPVVRFPIANRLSLPVARAVRARFTAEKADVLHVTGYKTALHARLSGVRPLVATVHGWLNRRDLKERFYGRVERACLRRCDRVICLSSYYEDLLLRAGVRRDRLVRIPTGLDPAALPDPAACVLPPADPFTLLHAGRMSEEKNHDLLLRASARLMREGLQFRVILAGEGPLRGAIERRIAELELSDRVIAVGFVPMNTWLPQTHALVLCSKIENLPVSILEAMSWARPVVATRVGGIPDLVADGETGLLVPPEHEVALAAALRRLIEDPVGAAALGRAGRARLEAKFLAGPMIATYRALYRGLLNDAR